MSTLDVYSACVAACLASLHLLTLLNKQRNVIIPSEAYFAMTATVMIEKMLNN
jgi:hypothetical protein